MLVVDAIATDRHGVVDRSARFRSRASSAEAARHAVRADDHLQEARAWGSACRLRKKNALLCGGDIVLIDGELGGAAFRVSTLPVGAAHDPQAAHRHRRRRAEHRPVAAADSRRRGLRASASADRRRSCRREQRQARADLYLLDVRLPDGNGIDLLRSLRQRDEATPVVMISGHATIRDAVEATRSGAFDFLEKPLARDRVLLVVKHALERSRPAAREPAVSRAGRRRRRR